MVYCKICEINYCEYCGKGRVIVDCGGYTRLKNRQTNADRIRSMSDEELAKKIPCPYIKDEYDECKFGWHERTQTCEECALEWLRMTASN